MTANANPQPHAQDRSDRVQRIVAAIRAVEFKRTRRAMLVFGLAILLIAGWHLLPRWRMYALKSAIGQLKRYRDTNGRFPLTERDLADALQDSGSGVLGTRVETGGDVLRDTGVKYRAYPDGAGFTLHFNHNCFCDLGDTSRYEYDSWDDSWFSWCD